MKLVHIDLHAFPNLEKLRLANNLIVSIKSAGIHLMTNLRVLDLRNNRLHDIREATAIANKLAYLEFIGLRGALSSSSSCWVSAVS